MSILNPKVEGCYLIFIYMLLVGCGELCLMYFSLKYIILINTVKLFIIETQLKIGKSIILILLLTQSIFLFGLKCINFISYGTTSSKRTQTCIFLITLGLSIGFCVPFKSDINQVRYISYDLIALILGNILILLNLSISIKNDLKRKVNSNLSNVKIELI